jgi:hypothetical protein
MVKMTVLQLFISIYIVLNSKIFALPWSGPQVTDLLLLHHTSQGSSPAPTTAPKVDALHLAKRAGIDPTVCGFIDGELREFF